MSRRAAIVPGGPPPSGDRRWITRAEVFARFGLTRKRLDELVRARRVEIRIARGKSVFDAAAIEGALEEMEVQP